MASPTNAALITLLVCGLALFVSNDACIEGVSPTTVGDFVATYGAGKWATVEA